nr:recombinase family protein [uncultured Marivita sp.]
MFKAEIDSHLAGTVIVSLKGPRALHTSAAKMKLGQFRPKDAFMSETRIGYARCSTDKQDLAAQQAALLDLDVAEDRIYTDHGLTGTNRERPGLAQALAAVRKGDTLVVPKLDRLARSVPDARAIADELEKRGVKLALGASVHDPTDPMGKMFFNILATFAEFEADLIRMRTKEGMAIARAKGKLKGKKPKLSDRRQTELRMYDTGEYSISDLAELFDVSRPTVYRVLARTDPRGELPDVTATASVLDNNPKSADAL